MPAATEPSPAISIHLLRAEQDLRGLYRSEQRADISIHLLRAEQDI